jgi:hypothetical protein
VLLIANGANLETTDEEGDSTLHFASFGLFIISLNWVGTVPWILRREFNVDQLF